MVVWQEQCGALEASQGSSKPAVATLLLLLLLLPTSSATTATAGVLRIRMNMSANISRWQHWWKFTLQRDFAAVRYTKPLLSYAVVKLWMWYDYDNGDDNDHDNDHDVDRSDSYGDCDCGSNMAKEQWLKVGATSSDRDALVVSFAVGSTHRIQALFIEKRKTNQYNWKSGWKNLLPTCTEEVIHCNNSIRYIADFIQN